MNSTILNGIINHLALLRPYFYSEADFQHALAMALSAAGYNVFLEYPINTPSGVYYIDIVVEDNGRYYPIELKYKTKAFICSGIFGNIPLNNHSANNINRYLFWNDVRRIESVKRSFSGMIAEGYVVMLTNDEKYWTIPSGRSLSSSDQLFKIHPGMTVNNVSWNNVKGAPSYIAGKMHYPYILLSNAYSVPNWNHYSNVVNGQSQTDFKYLTLVV